MTNFWASLKRPIFALAPMEDVTDAAFRALIALHGKPSVMFTEFTSADGIVLAPDRGQTMLRAKLIYGEKERPIVAQLFSANAERMEKAAHLVADMGFDGIDINMGCPVKEVVSTGCGAALIKNPALAREIMRAVRRGAPAIPLSIKTRIGYDKDEVESWLSQVLSEKPEALTVHLRTRKEMSDVPAHWETMSRVVALRDALSPGTVVLGNGDVKNIREAKQKVVETGCDGVMLGRAIYGNPWLFLDSTAAPTKEERISALIEHLRLFETLLGETANFAIMKKHFKAYIIGWDNAKEVRVRLMETNSVADAIAILSTEKSM